MVFETIAVRLWEKARISGSLFRDSPLCSKELEGAVIFIKVTGLSPRSGCDLTVLMPTFEDARV